MPAIIPLRRVTGKRPIAGAGGGNDFFRERRPPIFTAELGSLFREPEPIACNPDFPDYAPFAQEGGIGKVWQLFGDELGTILDELNGVLAA